IESGIESLKKEYFGKKVLLVSHGITIQGVISYLNNGYVDLEDFSKIPVPDNLELYIFKIGG
ncbi:MAG: histidine phosphatase family protein, partial [Fusobacteriaceae bacterium]|nr:histidine phosphatase family protein [Fusobacteriaceae bacterium]